MSPAANILVIDDDESMRIACMQTLEEDGYQAQAVEDGKKGIDICAKESFDVVLLDLKMPGIPGIEVLKKLKENDPNLIIIVITGYATIDSAVASIKLGAYDYIPKPFEPELLISMVKKAVKNRYRIIEDTCMRIALDDSMISDSIIGRSDAILKVIKLIKKVASMDSTVLISGGTGSGKELVAKTIHRLSKRHDKPFVTVDCGSLVETLFESEMFGHVKGSFTGAVETTQGKFELADNGTIFLDEITNISYNMQSRLLRVIQEQEIFKVGNSQRIPINVRIIAATNSHLQDDIDRGKFREDLYYRLNVVHINVPPLRERLEDIPALSNYFLKKIAKESKKEIKKISDDAMRFLKMQEWPGNIRELKNTIERALVVCEGNSITPGDFKGLEQNYDITFLPENGFLSQIEKVEIIKALKQFKGHKSKTAEFLGINRKTLREKIGKYNINIDS